MKKERLIFNPSDQPELFTEHELRPASQKELIKRHLARYGWIQKLGKNGSLTLYGCDSLSQRVRELVRNEGMNIVTEISTEGKRYAKYRLVK